ncbi:hypothetical protein KFL_000690230 [Klebsormidium nitens]|uniref:MYND-type domain-containing protein n=1 Tax=Klebsormidium nitens TaxID=105231 RepID=A0A1Y1HQY4_KLENI|nr:hypothetical protein KFL_000690230 [Klebsormidium nitens]|eukprot:GAQ81044.1 hypothetical protein KFL_000690230 [Klebsormidium nitens]
MVPTKGRALSAGLAAYVLEQGVLDAVRKILKAAQTEGDFYVLPKIRSQDELNRTKYFVVSKVDICFGLLHVLILDTRTARFVLKGIPDLIRFLEGAYYSLPAVSPVRDSDFVLGSAYLEGVRDDDRLSSLEVLVSLASYSDRAKENLCSRKVLLHRILRDCMTERDFFSRVLECTLHCFSNLSTTCDLSEYLSEIIGVVLKTLAETQTAGLIFMAIHLFASIVQHGQVEAVVCKLHELAGSGRVEHLFPALFALAACPALDGKTKLQVSTLLGSLNKHFNRTILEERPTEPLTPTQQEKLEKLVRSLPGAMVRREQLREIFAAHESETSSQEAASPSSGTQSSLFQKTIDTPLDSVPDKAHVSYIPAGDLDAHNRPCRKCSRASCSNVESTSCEFKVCSGCRLTIYCSRECQKIA